MALLQIETEAVMVGGFPTQAADLYFAEEGWHITWSPGAPYEVKVIGPGCQASYAHLSDLLAAKSMDGAPLRGIPHLVKWAARGLAGIGAAEAGAV